jgi:hypothetical protein
MVWFGCCDYGEFLGLLYSLEPSLGRYGFARYAHRGSKYRSASSIQFIESQNYPLKSELHENSEQFASPL